MIRVLIILVTGIELSFCGPVPAAPNSGTEKTLTIPRVSKPWTEALRLVGDKQTLHSDFALIKDKVGRWHCIGTFGKGPDDKGNGCALSDGYSLFHAVGRSLDAPMAYLPKIGYQIESPQAYMWAPGVIWNKAGTTGFLYYFHYFGYDTEKNVQILPDKICCRLLTSNSPDLETWRPYSGTDLPETNMVFRERDDRDFCVFFDDRLSKFLMYYACAGPYRDLPGLTTIIRARTSDDLAHWSEPQTVMGPPPEIIGGGAESPFVLYRNGYYYLWTSGIDYSRTCLYISEDPFNFGDPKRNLIELQPGHAPEIATDNGIDYMACSMVSTVPSATPAAHDLDGILIQPLRWDAATPELEQRVTRKQ